KEAAGPAAVLAAEHEAHGNGEEQQPERHAASNRRPEGKARIDEQTPRDVRVQKREHREGSEEGCEESGAAAGAHTVATRGNGYSPFRHATEATGRHLKARKGALPGPDAIAGGGGRLQGTAVESHRRFGKEQRAVMNSIISEKRFAFVALPLLLATLA